MGWWVAFNAFVLAVLAVDLGVIQRRAHAIGVREAAAWVALWATLAGAFGLGVLHTRGSQAALEFFAGYLVEQSLSVDNIFVFVLIFSYFRVPAKYQRRVLSWGILGALVMRGVMIAAGAYLIHRFHWITYVFGAFLVVTGARMAMQHDTAIEPEANPVIRLIRRLVPVTKRYHEERFFIRRGGVWAATPLFIVLVLLETTDLVFALDSIPAVFGVTRDPFIVYTSNVFAILGLRSLYFLLAGIVERFHYLRVGLSVVLAFVGVKMLLVDIYPIEIGPSLGVIGGVLAVAVGASLLFPKREGERSPDARPRQERT
jgi:tellurite resistance protein TerC